MKKSANATISITYNPAAEEIEKCTAQTSDNGSTLGNFSMMIMMMLTAVAGLYYTRREEV